MTEWLNSFIIHDPSILLAVLGTRFNDSDIVIREQLHPLNFVLSKTFLIFFQKSFIHKNNPVSGAENPYFAEM